MRKRSRPTRQQPDLSKATPDAGPLSEPVAVDTVDVTDAGPRPSHLVGVGASAGGLEALEQFFRYLPADSGMAYVVIQHLSPDFRSVMDELLARHTTMPIRQITGDQGVEPNVIYLMPPRRNVVFEANRLQLIETAPRNGLNLPIDVFLESLATEWGDRAVAVILSGTGSDGTRGLRAVKEAGGIAMVQEPASAKFDGMPRSAVCTGMADFVLPVEQLPGQLLRVVKHPLAPPGRMAQPLLAEATKLDELIQMLRKHQGVDFSHYKLGTLSRRIERRMGINHTDNLDDYLRLLGDSAGEGKALARDLLIGVTQFFRDRPIWDTVRCDILPRIMNQENNAEIRLWVPACSTGEEVYSLAMLVAAHVEDHKLSTDIKIFGTDIDSAAIDRAGRGIYPESIGADVDPALLNRFFKRRHDTYEIKRSLREMVILAVHNLISDPPFTKMDIITCRNLLIYLQPSMQNRLLSSFHFSLKPHGYLVLGSSETTGNCAKAFHVISEKHRIFRKDPKVHMAVAHVSPAVDIATRLRAPLRAPDHSMNSSLTEGTLLQAYERMARLFAPPGVLLDGQYCVIHTFGDTQRYVQLPNGPFSSEISKMAAKELRLALSAALHRASKTGDVISYNNLRLKEAEGDRVVNLCVAPIVPGQAESPAFLAFFHDAGAGPATPAATEAFDAGVLGDQRFAALEHELQQSRENLQATIEELETSNEELQSTNEELLASNEELQSTNEELHSVNEELYTVNAEYQSKINELTELTNDFDNLLRCTDIGVVFVDAELRVRKFTPAARLCFNLLDYDVGRPIDHLTHRLHSEQLIADIRTALATNQISEKEVCNEAGNWFLLRILPFLNHSGESDGVLLTLVDIGGLKKKELELRRLASIVDSSDDAIMGIEPNGALLTWNKGAQRVFGHDAAQASALRITDLFPRESHAAISALLAEVLQGRAVSQQRIQALHASRGSIWVLLTFSPIADTAGRVTGLSVVGNDITEQTRAEESIRRLATIVRDSNDAVTIQDFEGHILAWNRGAERNYGYSQEEAVGMNVDAILPETEREATRRLYASFKEGANCDSFETKRLTRDGRCLDVWMTASILADDQGVPVAICTTERDITQRNRHLAALREAAERFARSNQDLDRFASMVSHDLNEPLRTIVGFCKLLATEHGGNMADPAREYIDRIQSAGRRMQRQIADLLEFSRLAGQEFERRPTDLNQLLGKVVETLSAGLAECGGTVSWGNLPTLCISESLLGQVFQNLIDNAIKYRRDEPPRVQVAALRVDDGWQVSVQDNGLGILPEHFAKVFEPFRRLHRAAESPGSGMGLAISKRIVERLGGRIWVESQYGQGSTFLVMLPDGSQSHHEPSASSSSVGG